MMPVMRSASKVNGLLFIGLLLVMFIYSVPQVMNFARIQTREVAGLFLDGRLLRQFEDYYDEGFFLRDFAVRQWRNLQYLVFGEASRGAVLGRDGWVFSNQEYLLPNDWQVNLQQQVQAMQRIQAQLQEQGIQLLILPLPMKVDIHAEHRLRQPHEAVDGLYDIFVDSLQAQELQVVQLRQAFLQQAANQDLFMRSDSHWNPLGARLAARETLRQFPMLRGDSEFVTQPQTHEMWRGDLLNFLNFDPRLAPDYFEPERLLRYETSQRQAPLSSDLLFGERSYPLLLVGTSYSRMPQWHFAGFLQQALGSELLVQAADAQGPFQVMQTVLDSDLLATPGLTTVIWEFPVRTLMAYRINQPVAHRQAQQFF